jgi:hypothetical protein
MLTRKVLDDVETVQDLPASLPAIPHSYICFVNSEKQYYIYDHQKLTWGPHEFSMDCTYYKTNTDGYDQNLNWAKSLMRDKAKDGLLSDREWDEIAK